MPDSASRADPLVQTHNWSATPLGHADGWPEPLRSAVRLILASPIPSFIWWGSDLIHLHNDAAARLLGNPGSLGRPAREIPGELWQAIGREARDVIEHNRAVDLTDREVVLDDGNDDRRALNCSFSLTPIRDEHGRPAGVLGLVVEESAAGEDLNEGDNRRNEFLAILAHELRNPLASLQNAAELLSFVDSNPMSLPHARTIIERQLAQLVRLVDDLLDVSRLSRGQLELKGAPMDLRAAVAGAAESIRPLAETAGLELTVQVPDRPVRLHGDRARLAQAVGNLLTNAVQYTERGGHIALRLDADAEAARVRVEDDGIGIEHALQPKLFEMFTQGRPRGGEARRGLGLGLAVAHRIAELHGGSLSASSDGPGGGSVFTLTVPLLEGRSRAKAARTQQGRGVGRRILIADDNTDAASALAEVLGMSGHDVRTANDGLQALEIAEWFRPELILLDIGMPRLDGFEACRRIRQHAWGRNVPIYAVTGWGQPSDRRRTSAAGFNAHLVKPVPIAAIKELIARPSH